MDVQLHAEGRRLLDERLATTRDKLEAIPKLSGHEQAKVDGSTQAQAQPQQHHRAPTSDLLHVSLESHCMLSLTWPMSEHAQATNWHE